ncbi:MAG: methyltransferase domain-containing protein [Oscillospiraceae bacterium]|nr:methyltransferase domain-containing protein [Oscillospiraceae bacterium]
MDTVWSQVIQGCMTLYTSRRLRFDDRFRDRWLPLFDLSDKPLRILEIGCGPGALAETLKRWYPKAEIIGLDRDREFIRFARERVQGVEFLTGDATDLPFPASSFDVTISNTVQEHVEPGAFFGEQLRVLRPGGVCLVLSTRKGLHIAAPCLAWNEEERTFWEKVTALDDSMEKYGICRYPMSEAELPAAMERHGFRDVRTGYAAVDLTPDDPAVAPDLAREMILSGKYNDAEALEAAARTLGDKLDAAEVESIRRRIDVKYEARLEQYARGEKQWETVVNLIIVLRGVKP